MFENINV